MRESMIRTEIYEKGVAAGEARGLVRGLVLGERQSLVRRAARRFGPVTVAAGARLETVADPATVDRLDDAMATAHDWAAWLDAAGVRP